MPAVRVDAGLDRSTFIGGSDLAAILGLSPWKTEVDLWLEKTGRADVEAPSAAKARRFALGKKIEPVILDLAVERLREEGHDVVVIGDNERFVDAKHRFLSSELDRHIVCDGLHQFIEAKSVNSRMWHEWGKEGTDEAPVHYVAQGMHGLSVTGLRRCYLAAMIGLDDVKLYPVERDETTIKAIRKRAVAWWKTHVVGDVAPTVTSRADVRALYPEHDGSSVEATPELMKSIDRLRFVASQRKALEAEEHALKFEVERYVASSKTLTHEGRRVATFGSFDVPTFEEAAFRRQYPDLAALFTTSKGRRALRLA